MNTRVIGVNTIQDIKVSTIYIAPEFYETMVFVSHPILDRSKWDGYQKRYKTEQEAIEGHDTTVAEVRAFYRG